MIELSSVNDPRLPDLLKDGRVGVIPTDTIYGLATSAIHKEAVKRFYRLKQRENKPGTVIAASIEQFLDLGLDHTTVRAVAHLWPNSLSIIVPASIELSYLDHKMGLAVRIPADVYLRKLLEETGPLLTSSANHPGQPPANTVKEAQAYFGDRVDFYVDGGDLSGRPPSTLARYKDGKLEILRQGAVKIDGVGRIS